MSTTLSCGECGAPLRPEQDWCSLCYASVAPAFDPLTAPLHEVVAGPDVPDAPSDGAAPGSESHPASRVSATDATSIPAATVPEVVLDDEPTLPVSDVDVMLSMLAAEHRENDPTAGLAERLGDKSTRMMVMFGGMLAIGLVGFLLLTALGAIF